MKRWTLRFFLCLVLGAITTVAVAWGIGAAPKTGNLSAADFFMMPDDYPAWWIDVIDARGHYLQWSTPGFNPEGFVAVDGPISLPSPREPPHWSVLSNDSTLRRPAGDRAIAEFASGFPALAARAIVEYSHTVSKWQYRQQQYGIHLRPVELQLGSLPDWRVMPFYPIWSGFLIDTLFYAAIWFGVFVGCTSAKRFIRIKRGRCPRCGYDLRGGVMSDQRLAISGEEGSATSKSQVSSPKPSPGCPECGWNRSGA